MQEGDALTMRPGLTYKAPDTTDTPDSNRALSKRNGIQIITISVITKFVSPKLNTYTSCRSLSFPD